MAFHKGRLKDLKLEKIFNEYKPCTIHLAAQAGVRHSIDNPKSYINSNLVFANILECCRKFSINNFFTQVAVQYMEDVNHPVSLYAATKRFLWPILKN